MEEWRAALGNDLFSELVQTGDIQFVAYRDGDYRLIKNPWPSVASAAYLNSSDPRRRVDRDFYGNQRSQSESGTFGAFSITPMVEIVGVQYREIFANDSAASLTMADFSWVKHNYNLNSPHTQTYALNWSNAENYYAEH